MFSDFSDAIFDSSMIQTINNPESKLQEMTDKVSTAENKEVPQKIVGALADAFDKSPLTIQRWIDAEDDRLTSDRAKEVYAKEGFDWSLKEFTA